MKYASKTSPNYKIKLGADIAKRNRTWRKEKRRPPSHSPDTHRQPQYTNVRSVGPHIRHQRSADLGAQLIRPRRSPR
jgi:hypothetical protein